MLSAPSFPGGGQVHSIWSFICGSFRPSHEDPCCGNHMLTGACSQAGGCLPANYGPVFLSRPGRASWMPMQFKLSGCKSFCLRLSHTACGNHHVQIFQLQAEGSFHPRLERR